MRYGGKISKIVCIIFTEDATDKWLLLIMILLDCKVMIRGIKKVRK